MLTLKETNEYIASRLSNLNPTWETIVKRFERNNTILEQGISAGRFLVVKVNGYVFHVHEDKMFFCLNSSIDKKVKKSLLVRFKRIRDFEEFANQLDRDCEYPFKQGAMVCINKAVDSWGISARWASKMNTTQSRITVQQNEIDELITANYIRECDYLELMEGTGVYYESEIYSE